ncbi:MAG: DUF2203 family protein [Fuerstiella sp.]
MATDFPGMSVEDANRRLPLVRVIVKDAVELRADVTARQERLLALRDSYPEGDLADPYAEEVLQMEQSLEIDEERVAGFADELRQLGAELVDPAAGLVEFPSAQDGEAIRLSWMYNEPEVSYWRAESELPSDRRPLVLTGQQAG